MYPVFLLDKMHTGRRLSGSPLKFGYLETCRARSAESNRRPVQQQAQCDPYLIIKIRSQARRLPCLAER